jgi:hypothetical protein
VPVISQLKNIPVPLASIRPQVALIRSDVSRIGTDIAPIPTQVSTFAAIDMPVLCYDNTARKTHRSGK